MTIIMGIDPGSRRTGYGVIEIIGQRTRYISSGHLDVLRYPVSLRWRQIYLGLQTLLRQHQPDEIAVEQVFMHRNPSSALKLGQARGAALAAFEVPIFEYSTRSIKQMVVGYGGASKDQVQYMIQKLLQLQAAPQADAADALAAAVCHGVMRSKCCLREDVN